MGGVGLVHMDARVEVVEVWICLVNVSQAALPVMSTRRAKSSGVGHIYCQTLFVLSNAQSYHLALP